MESALEEGRIVTGDAMFAYVGVKPCGCMVAAVADYGRRQQVGKSVDQMIRRGLVVCRVPLVEARSRLKRCECAKK